MFSSTIQNINEKEKSSIKRIKNVYCANCGEKGHVVKECEAPVTSFGIIAFKEVRTKYSEIGDTNEELRSILKNSGNDDKCRSILDAYPKIKFLMIQRKDTMGFIDFVRGKYPTEEPEKENAINILLGEMTYSEKEKLLKKNFDEIWRELWNNHDSKCFKNEYELAKRKYESLPVQTLAKESQTMFSFAEFGFPKGRRNMRETNIGCAEREFHEESGYDKSSYEFVKYYPTIQEEFIGTNGITYRHIYYLVKMKNNIVPPKVDIYNKVQSGEVQNIAWLDYSQCMSVIRPYDTAKMEIIKKVYEDLLKMNGSYDTSTIYQIYKKPRIEAANKSEYISIMKNLFLNSKRYLVDTDELKGDNSVKE
jgi:8-oxo-dGTP pyrophosphatase MutT (NUDIX family)